VTLDKTFLECLGKVAYDKHIESMRSKPDDYFQRDVTEWRNLPSDSRNHWTEIARAVAEDINSRLRLGIM
jgi:hypothetical protein